MTTPPNGIQSDHRRILIIFMALAAGMLLAALDQTIIASALPTIVGDLHGLNHYSWVATAYLLTSTTSTLLYGKISDLYGRKNIFQMAIIIFIVGSMLAGLSQTMNELILFRAIQGLGAGGLMVVAMSIIGDVVSPRERGKYQGYMGAIFGLATIAGPLLGGYIVQHFSWRWVFYINVPVAVLALVVTQVVLNIPFVRHKVSIDYLGTAILTLAVTCLILATTWGGTTYAWGSWQVLTTGTGAVIGMILFILREHLAEEPILPLRLFRISTVSLTSISGFIVGMSMFGAILYLPLYLQIVKGSSPTGSGLQLIPLIIGLMGTSVFSGQVISRTGRYKIFPVVGSIIATVGFVLFSTVTATTSMNVLYLYMFILGVGIGCIMQVLVIAAQNAVAQKDLGITTATNSFFRSIGGTLGTAFFGAILTARLTTNLVKYIPARYQVLIPKGSSSTSFLSAPAALAKLPPALHEGIILAFAHSLQSVYLWAIPISAVGIIVVLFLKELKLRSQAHIGTGEQIEESIAALGVEPMPTTAVSVH